MRRQFHHGFVACLLLAGGLDAARAQTPGVVFETTSAYHNIRVLEQQGLRVLSFDGSMESKMSIRYPLTGHFGYTELFHMPWLWNTQMSNVLMVGLGGASTQRSYAYYYTNVMIETVEIDPVVLTVATQYFNFKPSFRQRMHLEDGRVFLRRTQKHYDAILMDAYTENRYGSFLPQHLATREFFELARARLTTNGVLAYNVIGDFRGFRTDLLGAMHKTLKAVFPHVYMFPAHDSQNVVLIATKSSYGVDFNFLRQRAATLMHQRRLTLHSLYDRLYSFRSDAPANAARAPVLTDDFAPVEGLLQTTGR